MPKFKIILLILLSSTLSACATLQFGQDVDIQKFIAWVKPGQTTQNDVRNFLGQATSKGQIMETDGTLDDRWTYYYGKGKMTRLQEADFKTLEIRFDSQGRVKTYNWSEQIKRPRKKKEKK